MKSTRSWSSYCLLISNKKRGKNHIKYWQFDWWIWLITKRNEYWIIYLNKTLLITFAFLYSQKKNMALNLDTLILTPIIIDAFVSTFRLVIFFLCINFTNCLSTFRFTYWFIVFDRSMTFVACASHFFLSYHSFLWLKQCVCGKTQYNDQTLPRHN